MRLPSLILAERYTKEIHPGYRLNTLRFRGEMLLRNNCGSGII